MTFDKIIFSEVYKLADLINSSCKYLLCYNKKDDLDRKIYRGPLKCFHNGIILIVNCFKLVFQR